MAVADVTALIPPPTVPNQVGTLAEWRAVERELGVTFPADYSEFVFAYGTGQLGRFYSVWNPFWGFEFAEQVRLICGYERQAREMFPQYVPYPSYPESPGCRAVPGAMGKRIGGWLKASSRLRRKRSRSTHGGG